GARGRRGSHGGGPKRRGPEGRRGAPGGKGPLRRAGPPPAPVQPQSGKVPPASARAMCTGAILLYGIPHVVVGENRTFMGDEDRLRARGVRVDIVQDEHCVRMMTDFIRMRPELWNEDIGV